MAEAAVNHDLPDLAARIAFLFPGVDVDAGELDDEGHRLGLVGLEHEGWQRHDPGLMADEGRQRLHESLHLVVVNQVLSDDPPEAWLTLQRIVAKGYTRHDALHMAAAGMSNAVHAAMQGRPQSPEVYLHYLAGLPEQAMRDRPAPTARTGGRPHRSRKKRR